MKKLSICAALLSVATLGLSACSETQIGQPITCAEIEQTYIEAGYWVSHIEPYVDANCCIIVSVQENSEDSLYFYFYDTAAQAQKKQEETEWNILIWLFSLVLGDGGYVTAKTYNNIEYDYSNEDLTKPFENLIRLKND